MKDLFGFDAPAPVPTGKGGKGERKSVQVYKRLVQLYGLSEGHKCGSCAHFYFRVFSKKYPKCKISGLTGQSQNHDWSSRWAACGKFIPSLPADTQLLGG